MTRYAEIEKALQNMMGMFDTPTMRLQIKFSSWMEEACASGRAALALPEDGKTVNAELYGLAVKLADEQAREEITQHFECDSGHYYECPKALRYLSLREASGEPMPYRVVRDGDKVRFE